MRTVWADGWTRNLPIGEVAADEQVFEPLVLGVWGEEDGGTLHGLCTYYNIKPAQFAIAGIETPDGDFYPSVSAQVANEKEASQWSTIKAATSPVGKPTMLTVEAKAASKALKVDLELFRPFIKQWKYGRLMLTSGEFTVFQLEDLLPPDKRTASSADSVRIELPSNVEQKPPTPKP